LKKNQGEIMNNEKLWLLVDSTLKKLLHAQYWATSIDSYKEDIDQAVESLKKAKKKIEEEK
tara:strand:+ start:24 stop:206 length:183 start_codon:yes stop_codon:yes gene_type:complete